MGLDFFFWGGGGGGRLAGRERVKEEFEREKGKGGGDRIKRERRKMEYGKKYREREGVRQFGKRQIERVKEKEKKRS